MDATSPSVEGSLAMRLLAETCDREGSLDHGVRFLRQALDRGAQDAGLTTPGEIAYAFVLFNSLAGFEGAVRRAIAPAGRPGEGTAPAGSSPALSVLGELLLVGRGHEQRLERPPAAEPREQPGPVGRRPTANGGAVWLRTEQLDRARGPLEALAAHLLEPGEDAALAEVLVHLARFECYAGNIVKARALADCGFAIACRAESDSLASHARAIQALVYAHEGRVAETRATAGEATQRAARSGCRTGALWASTALALLERSLGNDEAVLTAVAPWLRLVERDGVVDPGRTRYLPDAIEALIDLGDLERAARLTEQFDRRARALDRPSSIASAARCGAMIQAARGEVRAALDALNGTLADVGAVPVPLDLARTLLLKGRLERGLRCMRRSAESIERALRICEHVGAAMWVERARSEVAPHAPRASPAC